MCKLYFSSEAVRKNAWASPKLSSSFGRDTSELATDACSRRARADREKRAAGDFMAGGELGGEEARPCSQSHPGTHEHAHAHLFCARRPVGEVRAALQVQTPGAQSGPQLGAARQARVEMQRQPRGGRAGQQRR